MLRMKKERRKREYEEAAYSSWVNKSRKLEKGRVLLLQQQRSKIFEEAEIRNNAYHFAYAKADDDDEVSKLLADQVKKQEQGGGGGVSGPHAIALLATSNRNNNNETLVDDDQNPKMMMVFTEMGQFVRGLAPKDHLMRKEETCGSTEVKESIEEQQQPDSEDKEIVPHETTHEVPLGKGLSGALELLKYRGTLKQSTDHWGGGRNLDNKKSKLVGILAQNKKEIHIERTDEFGRTLTPKKAFRLFSHKFHGKLPSKMKQEKRIKQYSQELKMKQYSDTPQTVERMRETLSRLQTPYLVLT